MLRAVPWVVHYQPATLLFCVCVFVCVQDVVGVKQEEVKEPNN